jgi:hypothetical protein
LVFLILYAARIFGCFSTMKVVYVSISTQDVSGYNLGDFFTNSSSHSGYDEESLPFRNENDEAV